MSPPHSAESIEHRFRHETLFYSGEDGFVNGVLPSLTAAIAAQEPALVAVGNEKILLLQEALGEGAEHVHFTDMRLLGVNPARIIPAWSKFLEDHASDGRPVLGIGEPIWSGRSSDELTECHRHEALLNVAFDGGQAWKLLCPYDLEGLDDEVIEMAERTHPFIAGEGLSRPSDAYAHARSAPGPFDGELPPSPADVSEFIFDQEGLAALRQIVADHAAETSLDSSRIYDLVLSVDELASNSVSHGGGGGTLRVWRQEEALVCEVRDDGCITEPLVGRIRPLPIQLKGRGLWFANHLCDLVQIRSSPAGSVIRLHMRLV